MHEDELLRRLAETAREEEDDELARLDPRWDALAAGTLSPADKAALKAEAETSAAAREALEAFSPLDAGFRTRMVDEARQMLQATATARDAEAVDRIGPADPLRPRRVAWLGGSAAAAALAAAGLVLVLWPRTDLEPLPGYFAELSGGVQEMRGPETPPWPSATTVFAPGNTFDLVLRPDRAVTGPVEVRIFLEHEQTLREWRVPRDIVDTGAARIRGEVGLEIDLPPGASTLYVVLGRPGSLPSGEELGDHLAGLYQVSAEDWVAWRREVELRSP